MRSTSPVATSPREADAVRGAIGMTGQFLLPFDDLIRDGRTWC